MSEAEKAWRAVYATYEGRKAIGSLMAEFGLFNEVAPHSSVEAGIRIGERNVLSRIARHIGRTEEAAPEDFSEDVDLMSKMLNYSGD